MSNTGIIELGKKPHPVGPLAPLKIFGLEATALVWQDLGNFLLSSFLF